MPRQPPKPRPEKAAPKGKAAKPKPVANLFNPPGRPQPSPPSTTITLIHRFESPSGAFPWVTMRDLQALEAKIMTLAEEVAKIKTALADMKARVQADIDDLKAKVAAGAATPEIIADLESIANDIGSFDQALPPPAP